jgi:Meiotically up-regulated gene 113
VPSPIPRLESHNHAARKRLYSTFPDGECVYVVGFRDYVKIGSAKEMKQRFRELDAKLPENLTLYTILDGYQELELRLHQRFAAHRLEREWFRKEGELAEWIAGGCVL